MVSIIYKEFEFNEIKLFSVLYAHLICHNVISEYGLTGEVNSRPSGTFSFHILVRINPDS